MNPDVKAKWTAALRSGEYRQGHGKLHARSSWVKPTDVGSQSFCCLGVLCHLASLEGVVKAGVYHGGDTVLYEGQRNFLPRSVVAWAGLNSINPELPLDGPGREGTTLVRLNDDRHAGFHQIADLIEEYL